MLPRRLRVSAFASALALCTTYSPPALSIPLSTLEGSGPIAVGDLVFSEFDVGSVLGALSSDLSLYDVELLADGIVLRGPLFVLPESFGLLDFSYQVSASDPARSFASASLALFGSANGGDAAVLVDELIGDGGGSALSAFAIEGGGMFADATGLPPVSSLAVDTGVLLSTLGGGLVSSAFRIEQHFVLVPEPGTLGLVSAGIACLGLAFMGSFHDQRGRRP